MSAVDLDQCAATWARELEDREVRRSGVRLAVARDAIARRTTIPAGTLENLRRGRSKGVRAWIFERLRTAYLADLDRQMKALAHETELTKSIAGADHRAVVAIEAVVRAYNHEDLS